MLIDYFRTRKKLIEANSRLCEELIETKKQCKDCTFRWGGIILENQSLRGELDNIKKKPLEIILIDKRGRGK